MLPDLSQITIVGTGLLGASLGLALKRFGYAGRIVGTSRRQETLDEARRIGAIDEAHFALPDAMARASLVVVCVPLGQFEAMFSLLAPLDRPGIIYTDVGSTKVSVLDAAKRLPDPSRFVGSHPMAGSEQQGPAHAAADLFIGKPCVVTPGPREDLTQCVTQLWRGVGMRVLTMTPHEHDRKVAAVSHLPHAAAVALTLTAARLGGLEVASTGFRDTTRLASSNPPMRADIIHANRDALREALLAYRHELDALLAAMQRGEVITPLTTAKEQRDQWLHTTSQET